jgi:hypothetical protein
MISLSRVRADVLCHQLEDQVLVYDPQANLIHLLDRTTACAMQLLQEGGRSVEETTEELAARIGYVPSPGILWLAVEELRKAGLLDESDAPRRVHGGASMFRRHMLKKVASAGVATMLVPLVVTLTPDPAYGQASICVAHHQCCVPGQPCCDAKDDCKTEKACDKTTGFQCK